jgi:HSP20 family molecular chaperone IbpA
MYDTDKIRKKYSITDDTSKCMNNTLSTADNVWVSSPGTWVGDIPPYNSPNTGEPFVPGQVNPAIWPAKIPGGTGVGDLTIDDDGGWHIKSNTAIHFETATINNSGHRHNIYVDTQENYCIDIEITGYTRDQMELTSVGQKVVLRLSKEHKGEFVGDDDVVGGVRMIEEGIPIIDWEDVFIIPDEYKVEDLSAKRVENGLLKIVFPAKDKKVHSF